MTEIAYETSTDWKAPKTPETLEALKAKAQELQQIYNIEYAVALAYLVTTMGSVLLREPSFLSLTVPGFIVSGALVTRNARKHAATERQIRNSTEQKRS